MRSFFQLHVFDHRRTARIGSKFRSENMVLLRLCSSNIESYLQENIRRKGGSEEIISVLRNIFDKPISGNVPLHFERTLPPQMNEWLQANWRKWFPDIEDIWRAWRKRKGNAIAANKRRERVERETNDVKIVDDEFLAQAAYEFSANKSISRNGLRLRQIIFVNQKFEIFRIWTIQKGITKTKASNFAWHSLTHSGQVLKSRLESIFTGHQENVAHEKPLEYQRFNDLRVVAHFRLLRGSDSSEKYTMVAEFVATNSDRDANLATNTPR